MDHFIEIIETDSLKAFKLFFIFLSNGFRKSIKINWKKNETAQHGILKVRKINNFLTAF